jgi:hypothetical protein
VPRCELADDVAHQRDDVRLVDRARDPDAVTEVLGRVRAVARELLDDLVRVPAAAIGEPARRREVVVGDARDQPVLTARRDHPRVVVERVA